MMSVVYVNLKSVKCHPGESGRRGADSGTAKLALTAYRESSGLNETKQSRVSQVFEYDT